MRSSERARVACALLAVVAGACDDALTVDGTAFGLLIVSNETTGGAFDVDGFWLRIDDGPELEMELNQTLTLPLVAAGAHSITLSGLATNCSSAGARTRTVEVEEGRSTRIEFVVACVAPSELVDVRLVYTRREAEASALVAVNADGSGEVTILSGGFPYAPDVSPDRLRIVFVGGWQTDAAPTLDVVNADGTGLVSIASSAYSARWSPDAGEVLFQCAPPEFPSAVCRIRTDGGSPTRITGQDAYYWDYWPFWSPDGSEVAFTRDEDWFDSHPVIWIVARDGSTPRPLTRENGGMRPVWSPTGRIAFAGLAGGIWAIDADGSGLETLLVGPEPALPHDWSADGRLLLFTRVTGPDRTDVFLLSVDDLAVFRITADGAHNMTPTFW